MSSPQLDPVRYAEGLALYSAGHGLATVFATCNAIEKMHDDVPSPVDLSDEAGRKACSEAHRAIENAIPSVLLGFAEGFLSDFRRIVRANAVTHFGGKA